MTASALNAPQRRSRPLSRDPDRTRAAILAAATREFTAHGLAGARVDAIAEQAGVNKRMIYHYFGDKGGLYLSVLEETYAGIRSAEIGLQLDHREPVEGVRELVLFTWDYFLAHPEFLSLLATENLHRGVHLRRSKKILELHSPLIGTLTTLLRRGAAAGVFRKGVDAIQLYISIAALGFFYLSNQYTLSTIFDRPLGDAAHLKRRRDHVVDMVLAYVKAERSS